ncbi:MAG: hypothetical protein Q8S73_25120 [Deltaproteobacteria bacterium]|nr:hypothetical protein [Deltaproteobacteria bacterium]
MGIRGGLAVAALALASGCRGPAAGTPGRTGAPGHGDAGAATGCQEVVTAPAAQQIFQQISGLRAADGCVMHGLTTQHSVMRVAWTRGGAALPGIEITPAGCAAPGAARDGRYVIAREGDFAAVCPQTLAALRSTLATDAPPPARPTAQTGRPPPRGPRRSPLLLVAVVAAVLAAVAWRRRARRSAPDV